MRTCYIPTPFGNLLMKTAIGADRTGKPPLRCWLLLHSSMTPLPGQWDRRQSCKYTLGATFVIISQKFLIARHKSFGRATIVSHNVKHVLWRAIAARVAFYSRPGLNSCASFYRNSNSGFEDTVLVKSICSKYVF